MALVARLPANVMSPAKLSPIKVYEKVEQAFTNRLNSQVTDLLKPNINISLLLGEFGEDEGEEEGKGAGDEDPGIVVGRELEAKGDCEDAAYEEGADFLEGSFHSGITTVISLGLGLL